METPKMDEVELRVYLTEKMKGVTFETLPAFIEDAMSKATGYGEVCVSIGAIAAAAAKAADRMPGGGITGFQGGAVFWEFVEHWRVFDQGPKRMVTYAHLLYPQYEDDFKPTISTETWSWVQEEAKKLLATGEHAAGRVRAHWESVAAGRLPFGLTLNED